MKYGQITVTNRRAFTLIELLVVIAIIALLISILLPALSNARKVGQATKCGANLHSVGQAAAAYLSENNGVFPPSYVYPDQDGNWGLDQNPSNPYGYIHWSYFFYSGGQAPETAFQCPTMPNGGHPRTNPGFSGWEDGQADQNGASSPNSLQDRQAIRMAYTGNAAIFPRNKFTQTLSGGQRVNVLVNDSKIHDGGKTILATEFNKNWRSTSVGGSGDGAVVKSHRPVNPFIHISSGSNEYAAGLYTPGFTYGDEPNFGLLPKGQVEDAQGLIDNPGLSEINAVGRHHPGGDGVFGGTANFLYADMHVEKKSVLTTMKNHEWGNRYYAIDGYNRVGPPWPNQN